MLPEGGGDERPEEDALVDSEAPPRQALAQQRPTTQVWLLLAVILLSLALLFFILVAIVESRNASLWKPPAALDYAKFHTRFQSLLSPSHIDGFMKYYSQEAHIAGSPRNNELAQETQAQWSAWGLTARLQPFTVNLTYPVYRYVSVVAPAELAYDLSLKEAVLPDGTSNSTTAVDTWNAFSASGDVTGKLAYVNYCTAEDFAAIANIDLTGTIVICRYGQIYRGNKADFAAARGAAGVLIYIDPADTGYLKGEVYMGGPWSTNTTVQRGVVWSGEGDPSTPYWPSSPDAPRLTVEQARDPEYTLWPPLPSIPIQPISYGDAEKMLKALGGNAVPSDAWAGGFNLQFIGPGPPEVHMNISVDYVQREINNVIATIRGSEDPDRLVILGCHRDSWTMGAGDPISGHSILMETARSLSELLKEGWRPRRTIVLASWDAEEYGLIGSVEYIETYAHALSAQAVIYLNLDVAVDGNDMFYVAGSPHVLSLMSSILDEVNLPTGKPAASIWDGHMGTLGSGSDFTGFIQHVGVTSMSVSFTNKSGSAYDAIYHSNYDSYYWFTHFCDPGFAYHTTLAKIWGLMALHFADDAVLPYNVTDYAQSLSGYVSAVAKGAPYQVSFDPLYKAIKNFAAAASALMGEAASARVGSYSAGELRALNDRLAFVERCFISDPVASGHPWFLHVLFAPSTDDSYAGAAMPSIQAALGKHDYVTADFLIRRIAQVVNEAAAFMAAELWDV